MLSEFKRLSEKYPDIKKQVVSEFIWYFCVYAIVSITLIAICAYLKPEKGFAILIPMFSLVNFLAAYNAIFASVTDRQIDEEFDEE